MRRFFALTLLAACHPHADTGAPDLCPRVGVVQPDLRDTERDAEGVASTLFGPPPDHTPDYTRAAGVLSLLEQVWAGAKTACPDLPSDQVAIVDAAIGRVQVAVSAQDQQAGAYAGNDVHMEMGPLFAYFNRDKPVELEEMDATMLRVGLDAWTGDWTSYDTNLGALNAEWTLVKPTIAGLVPTCHRVAGTQSVIDDVDQTLSTLKQASTAKDVAAAQIGSDDGLTEVDILEQLYDCPPDGAAPDSGLGSVCANDAACGGNGLVCDLHNAGGRCAPDPATTNVGAPSTTTVDCGTYGRDACNNEVGDGFPGGYCSLEPCDDVQVC